MADMGDHYLVYEVEVFETTPWKRLTSRLFYNGLDAYAIRDAVKKELKDNQIDTIYIGVVERRIEKKVTPEIINTLLNYI